MNPNSKKLPIYVYVAGPLTCAGDPEAMFHGVHDAICAASDLMRAGLTPFLPHTSVLHAIVTPDLHYEDWLAYDFNWLAKCDAVLRLPGESNGADREVIEAGRLGILVFYVEGAAGHNKGSLYQWAEEERAARQAVGCL